MAEVIAPCGSQFSQGRIKKYSLRSPLSRLTKLRMPSVQATVVREDVMDSPEWSSSQSSTPTPDEKQAAPFYGAPARARAKVLLQTAEHKALFREASSASVCNDDQRCPWTYSDSMLHKNGLTSGLEVPRESDFRRRILSESAAVNRQPRPADWTEFQRQTQTPQPNDTAFSSGSIWKCSSTPCRLRGEHRLAKGDGLAAEDRNLTRTWKSEDNQIGKRCRIPEVIKTNIERISLIADEFDTVNKSLTHIVKEEHMLLTSCERWGGRKDCGFFSKLDRVQVLNKSAKSNIRKAHFALKDCIVAVNEFNEAMEKEEENMILRAEEIEENSRVLFPKISQRSQCTDNGQDDVEQEDMEDDLTNLDLNTSLNDDVFTPSLKPTNPAVNINPLKSRRKRLFF